MKGNDTINHSNKLPDDIISTCIMSFLKPLDRMKSAFVSPLFHENALLKKQALAYWSLGSSEVFKNLESVKSICNILEKNNNEQVLDYLLGKKPTLSF